MSPSSRPALRAVPSSRPDARSDARDGPRSSSRHSSGLRGFASIRQSTVQALLSLPRRAVTFALRHIGFAATIGALLLLCGLQALSLWRAPAAWLPSTITVRLAAGESITLGQRELAAPQADKSHLSLRRDPQQGWMLRNLSASRQVILLRDGAEQRMGSTPLTPKQRFQINGTVFEVVAASDRSVAFARDGHAWRYDGAVLYHDGRQQDACPDAHFASRMLAMWDRWMPAMLSIDRPLTFGGNLHCDNRLGLPGVTSGAAQISRHEGRLELIATSPDGERASVLLHHDGERTDLRQQEAPLAGVNAIIVGHTRFQLDTQPDRLTLTPSRHIALSPAPDLKLPEQIDWQWQQRDLWKTPTGSGIHAENAHWIAIAFSLIAIAALLCTRAFAAARHIGDNMRAPVKSRSGTPVAGRQSVAAVATTASTAAANSASSASSASRRTESLHAGARTTTSSLAGQRWQLGAGLLASFCILFCGAAALVMQRFGAPPSAACSMLLAASALLLWLALPGRLSLATSTAVILLAIGLLAQLELGLGAPESSWLRYYQKSAAMLAIGAGLGGLLRVWAVHHATRGGYLKQLTIEWSLMLFAAIALAALAAEVLWGDETGVFDLQPVELAKMALTALTAHGLALRFNWRLRPQTLSEHALRWLQLVAPALLFVALMGLALVQVDDFSPLILLLVWSTVMAFAYALAARNHRLSAATIAVSLAAAGAIIYLRCVGSDDLIRWGFYADRFLVWLNPAEHPHTGQQLLLGARAITEGGWLGADHWLGLRSLGQSAGAALRIPAVQDDFSASFFLNRHGLAGGLLLWTLQAALLLGLVRIAVRAHAAGAAARDFRAAWSGRFRYFALCGGGAFLLGHFLLSWGTNLSIFPIMGQPMSFLSAGGSHLLFFLCPLLTLGAVSAQSLEEK